MRVDYLVDKALARRDEGVGEAVFIFRCLHRLLLARQAPEDDFDRAFRAHHRNFGGGPRVVEVAAQMF